MKDRFSHQAKEYANFRPTYPPSLFEFLLQRVGERQAAWDAGCGNGQVASILAEHFKTVRATDISSNQLQHAVQKDNIIYSLSASESTPFPDHTFDLITVGQALHWFDRNLFYQEVKRVAKPGALLAIWGYGLIAINSAIDPIVKKFYKEVVGPYWDAERVLVDTHYRTIDFPFEQLDCPEFEMRFAWSFAQFEGYVKTWSAAIRLEQAKGSSELSKFFEEVGQKWFEEKVSVRFPVFAKMGYVV